MKRAATALGLLLASGALSGCGTLANCTDSGRDDWLTPYGGVASDWRIIKQNQADPPTPVPLQLAVYACDLPLSAIGDTITLPVTALYTCLDALIYRDQISTMPATNASPGH